jgi:hypothetical protein
MSLRRLATEGSHDGIFASEAECNDLGNELARKMQYEKRYP